MSHHHSIRKEFSHHYHQFLHSLFLLWSASISESPLFIPSALVADANRASIIRFSVSPHLQEFTMLGGSAISSDIEVTVNDFGS